MPQAAAKRAGLPWRSVTLASPLPTPDQLSWLDAEMKMTNTIPTEGNGGGLQGSGQPGAEQRPSPWPASTLQPQKGLHWTSPSS